MKNVLHVLLFSRLLTFWTMFYLHMHTDSIFFTFFSNLYIFYIFNWAANVLVTKDIL